MSTARRNRWTRGLRIAAGLCIGLFPAGGLAARAPAVVSAVVSGGRADASSLERAAPMASMRRATLTGRVMVGDGPLRVVSSSLRVEDLRVGGVRVESIEGSATESAAGGGDSSLDLALSARVDGWEVPSLSGSLRWDAESGGAASTLFTMEMHTDGPMAIDLESSGVSGELGVIRVGARVRSGPEGVTIVGGDVSLAGGRLQAGDQTISDVRAEVVMTGPESVEVRTLGAVVGDGGTIGVEPFVWDPREAKVRARVLARNLTLEHWLPLVTSEHASGEGRLGGSVDVGLDWSGGTVKLTELNGSLRADPQRGFIRAADAESLGELLEKQDPRFGTDPTMRPVRDKIIAALKDFAFSTLTIDLSREGDRTVALTYLSGFGRHGEDPQGLNLTLDLHAQDSFVSLGSRIAAKSRLKKEARSALEEFFRDAPAGQEKQR